MAGSADGSEVSAAAESWKVEPASSGERLDRHLAERLGVPRNQVQQWIRQGLVTVEGAPVKASRALVAGEIVSCRRPPPRGEERISPEAGPLEVLYEDEDLAALSKPAGLAVHPGAGRTRGTLAHRLLARYPETAGVGGPGRPGIVHRLDKDTTGLLVVARSHRAYQALSRAFAERRIDKAYLGIVYGRPARERQTIEAPIGRHPQRRKEMAVVPRGRPAVTRVRRLGGDSELSLLELDLLTGRTHQIRVHLKWAGHPLIGDPLYGEARWKGLSPPRRRRLREFPRPALHAWRLSLVHPVSGDRLQLEAPPPADLRELWRGLFDEDLPLVPPRPGAPDPPVSG